MENGCPTMTVSPTGSQPPLSLIIEGNADPGKAVFMYQDFLYYYLPFAEQHAE
jgi:hypothetical protein